MFAPSIVTQPSGCSRPSIVSSRPRLARSSPAGPAQPDVRSLQADLVARCSDGSLRHVELRTTNDTAMPFRMLQYYPGLQRSLRERVNQTLFYAGRQPLRIPSSYQSENILHRYAIVNLREMHGEDLIA